MKIDRNDLSAVSAPGANGAAGVEGSGRRDAARGVDSPSADRAELSGLAGKIAAATAQDLANQVLNNPRITLARVHVSGVVDGADAHSNIVDTAQGRQARRSGYGTAPGGTVGLDTRMLQGVLNRAAAVSFSVSPRPSWRSEAAR